MAQSNVSLMLSLATSGSRDESTFQKVAQIVHDDQAFRNELGDSVAFEAVSQCQSQDNFAAVTSIFAIGVQSEIRASQGSQNQSGGVENELSSTSVGLAAAIAFATAEKIIRASDPSIDLESGYLTRDLLWSLRDASELLKEEFGFYSGNRVSTQTNAELDRLAACFVEVGGGRPKHANESPYMFAVSLSIGLMLSMALTNDQKSDKHRQSTVSVMGRRLFAGKHGSSSDRPTASPVEVQLCTPILAALSQQDFDNTLARPLQFKLLSERTSTVQTLLAIVRSLGDAPSWHKALRFKSNGPLNLLGHYEAPTNIAAASVRTLCLSETSRLGEDMLLALLRCAISLNDGTVLMASVTILCNKICESLVSALKDFEEEHDNHDEELYASIFVTLEGLGRAFTEATSNPDILKGVRVSSEQTLAADVIRSVEAVSNNVELPLTEETIEAAESALDEWEVIYKRREGEEDVEPPEIAARVAPPSVARRPLAAPGAVATNDTDTPQARKLAAFSREGRVPSSAAAAAPAAATSPGVQAVLDGSDAPHARKMAAFANVGNSSTPDGAKPGAAMASDPNSREADKAAAIALQGSRSSAENGTYHDSGPTSRARNQYGMDRADEKKGMFGSSEEVVIVGGARQEYAMPKSEKGTASPDYNNPTVKYGYTDDHDHVHVHRSSESNYPDKTLDDHEEDEENGPNLAVAVAINEEEEEKFIVAAEEFDPHSRVPLWKRPKFVFSLTGCIILIIVIAVTVSLTVSKNVVESANGATQTYRDTLGFYDIFANVSGAKVYEKGSSANVAAQFIVNTDPRELSPEDPSLIQRYILVLLFTSTDGWNWKWCGGVQGTDTCDYPCWDDDCNLEKCTVYDTPQGEYRGECTASRFVKETHECDWYGVSCSDDGDGNRTVTGVYFVGNGLSGPLIPEIGLLPNLQNVWFQDNALTGPIPPTFGNLTKLQVLNIHANQLTGTVPKELFKLNQTLSDIDIGSNQIGGTLAPEWGSFSNLNGLKVYKNKFTGPIPEEIFGLSKLQVLIARENALTGTLPAAIENLEVVRKLNLQFNRLSGPLPTTIGKLSFLSEFLVNNNIFNGTLPAELFQMTSLRLLFLNNNEFSGQLSPNVGNLKLLEELALNNNKMNGTLPAELGDLVKLTLLWVHYNKFEGAMPDAVCSRREAFREPSSLYADCFGSNSAITCDSDCCTHCCHSAIKTCFEN